jgi:RNA polymerase sigma-70 factor, ECF subfamily
MVTVDPSDAELLERWRSGDRDSGEALFERYYDTVERFFLNKIGDAISDLVQETFMRCVKNHDKIRDNQFRVYLFGIAYHVLNAHFRERYRDRGIPVDASVRDMADGPVTLVVQHRDHRLLLEALRTIPSDDQVILELHYWESLTTDEIAEVLAIPAGTARGRLQRARDKLGEVMHRLTNSPQPLATTVACLEDWARDCRVHLSGYRSA